MKLEYYIALKQIKFQTLRKYEKQYCKMDAKSHPKRLQMKSLGYHEFDFRDFGRSITGIFL